MDDVYIETFCEADLPQGQINKLKGMALEAAVQELMDELEDAESSLQSVLDKAEEHLSQVYNVKKMFRLNDGVDEITFRRQMSEVDSNFKLALDKSELSSDKVTIKAPSKSRKLFLGYKKCGVCDYIFPPKFCQRCGGAVFDRRFQVLRKISEFNRNKKKSKDLDRLGGASQLKQKDLTRVGSEKTDTFLQKVSLIKESKWNTENKWGSNDWCNCDYPDSKSHYFKDYKKCRKCGRGNYSKITTEFAVSHWDFKETKISVKEAVEYLQSEGYISESSFADKVSRKRLDTWRYDGERVEIFESKNKEKTGLTYSNIAQVFYYIKALRKSGLETTKDARIIYNGEFSDSLIQSLTFFEAEYGYSIDAISLREWCKEKQKFIQGIEIGKNIEGKKYSDNGEYRINVTFSDEFVENPELAIVRDDL